MRRKSLLVDIDSCYGCYTCEVACKQEHELPVGPRWIRVTKVGPKRVAGKLSMYFYPMHCMHCSVPACKEACPEDAIEQRADGVVLYLEEKCTGCMNCVEACPFGIPQYNPETNLVDKCNLCVDRIDRGELPACVHHCPTDAIFYGDPNEFTAHIQKQVAHKIIDRHLRREV